jgi:alpha-tubulin suppressor-like RCC1 family protein
MTRRRLHFTLRAVATLALPALLLPLTSCANHDLPVQPTASGPQFEIQYAAHNSGSRDPLTPSADTYLREGAPNQNQGTETSLRLQNSGNNRALLMWDPTAISQAIGAGTLTAARIELTISDNGDNWGTSGQTIDLHRMTRAWTETGATWNCAEDANLINHRPDCEGATAWEMGNPESAHPWVPTPTATQTIHNRQSGVVTLDVTADVAGIVTGGGAQHGWILKKTNEGANGRVEFGSRESASGSRLVLTVHTGGTLTFAAVSAGAAHTCGLTVAGAAYCWGFNGYGQLGDGTTTDRSSPVLVAAGVSFATVRAGDSHTCGVTTAGAAFCWGYNGSGQLGDGTTTDRSDPVSVAGGMSFSTVSAGGAHTCGSTTAGAAYCWGWNGSGGLGDETTTDRLTPVLVAGGVSFAAVSAGGDHTCGVTAAGAAYCWGGNGNGALGDGTADNYRSSPVPVAGGVSFAAASAGGPGGPGHTCGVTAAGAVYCWGLNDIGQVGDGTTITRLTPVLVAGSASFAAVDPGAYHTCGVTTAGAAFCWGANGGQLGDGTTTDRSSPGLVAGGVTFAAVDAGGTHTCGVTAAGAAYCWGYNGNGQLGDGTTTDRLTPGLVALQ